MNFINQFFVDNLQLLKTQMVQHLFDPNFQIFRRLAEKMDLINYFKLYGGIPEPNYKSF